MKIERRPLSSLSLDPHNTRSHSERNLEAIADSLATFGQAEPLVVQKSTNKIIGGNGRLVAMQKLGWKECDVHVVDVSNEVAVALGLALNRTTDLSSFEDDELALVLDGLEKDMRQAAGFTDDEFQALLDELGQKVEREVTQDEVPETPAEPTAKLGQLWGLGRHRVLCGDSRGPTPFTESSADLLLTDPPYGVSYVGKTKDALKVKNDDIDEAALGELVGVVFDEAQRVCRGGAYWYATVPAGPLHLVFAHDWKRRGILRQIMVWAKDSMVLGHSEYHYQHEPILFGWIPGERRKNSDRTRTTLWSYDRPKASREHPTMKPVALFGQAIKDATDPGDIVYDPFLGSGTTLIASEELGRKCIGVELSPQYVDVVIQRWQNLTGETATLLEDAP